MKHLLFITVFLVLSSNAFGQTPAASKVVKTSSGCTAYTSSSEENLTYEFDGDCKDGLISGTGIGKLYSNGKLLYLFEGVFTQGTIDGKGKFTTSKGDIAEGDFKNGKLNGKGTYSNNGFKYSGEFKDGKYNGQGTFTYVSGEKYVGGFKNNNYYGLGTHTFANGQKYRGEFKDSKKHGKGIYYSVNGSKMFEGIWADNNFISTERVNEETPQEEEDEIDAAFKKRTVEAYDEFIDKYPYSLKVPAVRELRASLIAALSAAIPTDLFQTIQMSKDPKLMKEFLDRYPKHSFAPMVNAMLNSVNAQAQAKEVQAAYNKALLDNKASDWEAFIAKYPDSGYITAAITQLRSLKGASTTTKSKLSVVKNELPPAVVIPEVVVKNEKPKEIKKTSLAYAKRLALVIGNDGYKFVNPLANAKNDAKAVAESLERVGYKVTLLLDQDEKSLKQALRQFKNDVEGGDEVLFFFAGHGVQIAGANYLLPTDIKGDSEDQVKDEAIQLQRFLDDMADRKTKLALAVIDACRDNPFKSAGRALGGRGLAATTPATGQMILFSAGSGQRALDNLGPKDKDPNGLFTRTFIKELQRPGIPVDRVLKNVREKVVAQAKAVGHEQVPALYDQVIGEFYFKK